MTIHIGTEWAALLMVVLVTWLYSRWIVATEPARMREIENAKTMHDVYCQRNSASAKLLQALLTYEVQEYRRVRRNARTMAVLTFLLPLTILCVAAHGGALGMTLGFLLTATVWTAGIGLFLCQRDLNSVRTRVYEIVVTLHKNQMWAGIAALIDAMEFTDEPTACRARMAVIDLLPCLEAEDGVLLRNRQRTSLHRALRGSNAELILAILQALEQIGDSKAISYVQRLTSCPVWITDSEHISFMAKRCLLALNSRMEADQTARALVRAVSASTADSEILVRPTCREEAREPKELLRVGTKPPHVEPFGTRDTTRVHQSGCRP